MAIVIDSVTSLHQHGTEFEDLLCESTGTILFCGDRVREGEGVESHIGYLLGIHLDGIFKYFLTYFFLKRFIIF